MLPKFLVGTYQQYKQDTKTFTTWLVVTARTSGYVSEAIPAAPPPIEPSSTPKAKPKAKSKTKSRAEFKKQQRDAARRLPQEQRKFVITPKEFKPLAQHIVVNLKPPSKVPSSILSMLKRAITARKDSDDWFRNNTREDDNDGHIHFVGILQDVYDILRPYVFHKNNDDEIEEDCKTQTIDNLFENLHIEEPSAQFLDAPSLPRPDSKKARMVCEFVDVFMEYVQSYFEETFAASSLFRDINKICQHVQQTWVHFKEGKVDLMSAAVVSNTAVELIRRLEEAFFEGFPRFRTVEHEILKNYKRYDPKHKDGQQLINFMFKARCTLKDKNPFNDDPKDAKFNLELYDDARYIFLDMLSILTSWYQGSQRMTKMVYNSESYGLWDPSSNYQTMSAKLKHHQDCRILLELFPDMIVISTSTSGLPPLAEDELLRGTRNLITEQGESPAIHLWMLASLRIFCDIHHVLGPEIEKPFETVRRLGRNASNVVQDCISQREKGVFDWWPESEDEPIKTTFSDRIQHFLFVDEVKAYVDHHGRNLKGWSGKKDFELFRRHPWACGLMEMSIHTYMETIGVGTLNTTGFGLAAAHLYNALQKEKLLSVPWSDMDTFLELMGDQQVFRGDRPRNFTDYGTRLSLLRGVSAETYARNRRDHGLMRSKRGCRQLSTTSDLMAILTRRMFLVLVNKCTTDGEIALTLAELEEALNGEIHLTGDENHVTARVRDIVSLDHNKKRTAQEQRYDPVELLMSLQFGLARNLPSITFDYFAFHKSCLEVLQVIHGICGPILDETIPDFYRGMDQFWAQKINLSVDFLLTMGPPGTTAGKMISTSAMPNIPAAGYEIQRVFDQEAMFKEVATGIQNKIVNGRLRVPTNVRVRKAINARPEMIDFEIQAVNPGDGHITFKKHKMWRHTDSKCTKNRCVCGVKAVPVINSGWRQAISEQADKWFSKGK